MQFILPEVYNKYRFIGNIKVGEDYKLKEIHDYWKSGQ